MLSTRGLIYGIHRLHHPKTARQQEIRGEAGGKKKYPPGSWVASLG